MRHWLANVVLTRSSTVSSPGAALLMSRAGPSGRRSAAVLHPHVLPCLCWERQYLLSRVASYIGVCGCTGFASRARPPRGEVMPAREVRIFSSKGLALAFWVPLEIGALGNTCTPKDIAAAACAGRAARLQWAGSRAQHARQLRLERAAAPNLHSSAHWTWSRQPITGPAAPPAMPRPPCHPDPCPRLWRR